MDIEDAETMIMHNFGIDQVDKKAVHNLAKKLNYPLFIKDAGANFRKSDDNFEQFSAKP